MSDPITVLLAKSVRDGIAVAVAASSNEAAAAATVWAFGATDDSIGEASRAEEFPDVFVRVRDCSQIQYRSTLRDYPIDIAARTWSVDDQRGVALTWLCEAVSAWLRAAPSTLTAAGVTVKALYIPDAPSDADELRDGGRVWGYQWSGHIKTQVTT